MKKLNKQKSLIRVFILSLMVGLIGPIDLRAATGLLLVESDSYSVLAGSSINNTGQTAINGQIGVTPGTEIKGLPLSSSANQHANDSSVIAAQADNYMVFDVLDQPCDQTFEAVDLTSTFPEGVRPGVYCSNSSFTLTGNLKLIGEGAWVFKSTKNLITLPGASVTGGDPCKVWWRVGTEVILEEDTSLIGNILARESITLKKKANLTGRVFTQNGVITLDSNTISTPQCTTGSFLEESLGESKLSVGTINVVKAVINDNGGKKTINDFPVFVNGTAVASGVANAFPADEIYTITETTDPNYTVTFAGDCDPKGNLSLASEEAKFCIIINEDIGAPASPPLPTIIPGFPKAGGLFNERN